VGIPKRKIPLCPIKNIIKRTKIYQKSNTPRGYLEIRKILFINKRK